MKCLQLNNKSSGSFYFGLDENDCYLCKAVSICSDTSLCPPLSGWCVLVEMVRWQSCVTLWFSGLSWMLTLQRNQWNQCCHWGSFLLVREDTPSYHLQYQSKACRSKLCRNCWTGDVCLSVRPSLQVLQMWFPVRFMESEIQSLQHCTSSWVGSTGSISLVTLAVVVSTFSKSIVSSCGLECILPVLDL